MLLPPEPKPAPPPPTAAARPAAPLQADVTRAELPAAAQVAPNYYAFYYHHHQLAHLIDMLRNEGPVYVFFNNDNGFANSRIATIDEPVGEGELT